MLKFKLSKDRINYKLTQIVDVGVADVADVAHARLQAESKSQFDASKRTRSRLVPRETRPSWLVLTIPEGQGKPIGALTLYSLSMYCDQSTPARATLEVFERMHSGFYAYIRSDKFVTAQYADWQKVP
jgi:hypothetical protein